MALRAVARNVLSRGFDAEIRVVFRRAQIQFVGNQRHVLFPATRFELPAVGRGHTGRFRFLGKVSEVYYAYPAAARGGDAAG